MRSYELFFCLRFGLLLNSVSCYLDAVDIPRFGDPLNNLTVSLGREATFICVVDDLGPYKVAWLRVDTQTILTIAGHVITKNDRIKVRHSGSRVWYLTILEVRQTDRGWYMCQINTDPMKNQIAYLDVVVPPDILDYLTSDDQVAREGSNVTLKCGAIGVPTPTLIWRREGGEPLRRHNVVDEHNTSITSAVLEFVRVNRMSMGAYLCIASNGIPPSVSKRIMLIVHFPPIVSIENQLRGADDGDSEVLECHSEAFPNSINFWTFNDQIISQTNPSYEISNKASGYAVEMRLKIRSVSRKTLGSYRCVAKNSLGDTDGTIKLYSRSGSSFEIDEDNSIEFFSETGSKSAARSQSTTLLHSTPFFQSFTRNPIEKLSSLLFVFIYVIIFFEFG